MLELKQIEPFYPEPLRVFKKNLLREYLQYKILDIIFSNEFAEKLNFMGGTAIHIVHSLPRFSEDLDFDNTGLDKIGFGRMTDTIRKKLNLEGYTVEAETSFKGAYRAFIRLAGILYENGISRHKAEKMLIQIDAEPQRFPYKPEKVIINKFDVFTRINVIPIDILLAQKMYAIFMRKRPMGRDFYDVIFLLAKTRPNFEYLSAKMNVKNITDLKSRLLEHCATADFMALAKDVRQFLFTPDDSKKITLFNEYIKGLE